MRELKFKAWSPSRKIWRTDWSISCYDEILHLNHWQNLQDEDLIIVQYTGLKDRNNKEIYEGDIVKDIDGAIFYVACNPPYFACYQKGPTESSELETHFFDLLVEIIGNVYENKQLLDNPDTKG